MEVLQGVAMEIRQRTSHQSQLTLPNIVQFADLRSDWVKGADVLVRLIARASDGLIVLQGFPRQWIPIFVHFGADFTDVTPPSEYIPIASDLPCERLETLCRQAQTKGALREVIEAFAALDPLVADVLYKLDRRKLLPESPPPLRVKLTGWQSYGRPEVLALTELVAKNAHAHNETAVLLPCARRRPYHTSKTHRRIWHELLERSVDRSHVDSLVVSSIGIVPEPYWNHPVVVAYDSGVPDIYRILRLMREYFGKARYGRVIDCLEFRPYSDCLQIVAREGLVGSVERMICGRVKVLPRP